MKKKSVAFKTLGCRLNQYETEALATTFKENDYLIVDLKDQPDVYIINSCTVTNQSDKKVRNYLSQARGKSKGSLAIVMGCISPSQKKILLEKKLADYLIDNTRKSAIFNVVEAHFRGETIALETLEAGKFDYGMPGKIFRTRGFLKIQDGCDNFCTFCIIPFVRGRAVSRPVAEVLKNARDYLEKGFRELVVTGVNIGRYHDGKTNFEDLLEKLLDIPGDFRLRISSLEPEGIGEKFTRLMAHPKMTPHLHLCLQSGSENILIKMKRMHGYQQFLDTVRRLRVKVPGINITTDIMVGFPGETEADFEQTLIALKKIRFGHVHTFKYSIRSGTRAERMEQQVPENVKNERSKIIHELSLQHKIANRAQLVGKKQRMLVEKFNSGSYSTGYGEHFVPIILNSNKDLSNHFVDVEITGVDQTKDHALIGRLIT